MKEALDSDLIAPEEQETDHHLSSRRELMGRALKGSILASPLFVLLKPEDAFAGKELTGNPNRYGGYTAMIDRFRRSFGRRQDYQRGFAHAARQSNRIYELPAGLYGILPKDTTRSQIPVESFFPVEQAGFLHSTQSIEEDPYLNLKDRSNKAQAELNKKVRAIILKAYPQYETETQVLDQIAVPVVTFNNVSAKRLEMFLRIPSPETTEFFRMATGRWADYYDQSKLRHKAPFDIIYDHSKSLFENLKIIYGPQLQAFSRATQPVKNQMARFIQFVNDPIEKKYGKKYALSQSQKDTLNKWLNVTGTTHEIK